MQKVRGPFLDSNCKINYGCVGLQVQPNGLNNIFFQQPIVHRLCKNIVNTTSIEKIEPWKLKEPEMSIVPIVLYVMSINEYVISWQLTDNLADDNIINYWL